MVDLTCLRWFFLGLFLFVCVGCPSKSKPPAQPTVNFAEERVEFAISKGYRGRVVAVDQVSESSLNAWKEEGWTSIALAIEDETESAKIIEACKLIEAAGLDVEYFLEVARCPKLADEHPEWMASLQGNDQWRRLHPEFPAMEADSVAKTYPWVPLFYAQSFGAQFERVQQLLNELPTPRRIWVNDIQGGPSASGCGNTLCRWTGDNGPVKTGHPLGDNAPADFVGRLGLIYKNSTVIPIWTTECEEADKHEACGGMNCYGGKCWSAWTRQINIVSERAPVIGVSCLYKAHERDLARYGEKAGWVKQAISFFQTVPSNNGSVPIPTNRLVAVLQGWNVNEEEIAAQISQATAADVRGILLVETPIDQSWEPKMHKVKKSEGRSLMVQ